MNLREISPAFIEKDEINVPIALSAFRDGDQSPSKVTKVEDEFNVSIALSAFRDNVKSRR